MRKFRLAHFTHTGYDMARRMAGFRESLIIDNGGIVSETEATGAAADTDTNRAGSGQAPPSLRNGG